MCQGFLHIFFQLSSQSPCYSCAFVRILGYERGHSAFVTQKSEAMTTNTLVISGRIAQKLELRSVSDGTPVTNIRLATDQGKDDSMFIDVAVWGKQAESVCQHLDVGSAVIITGNLRSRKYTNKQGVEVTTFEIRAHNVEFGAKQSGDGAATPAPAVAAKKAPADDYQFVPSDDLPF